MMQNLTVDLNIIVYREFRNFMELETRFFRDELDYLGSFL